MFVIVQITAAIGAFLFGFVQDKIGALKTNIFILFLWFVGVMGIYSVLHITDWLNAIFDADFEEQYVFLFIGLIAGVCLGSSQSASRTLVGLFTPDVKAAEFFGFWGLFYKIAGIFGIVGLGLLQTQIGLQRSLLFCAGLFLIAMVICFFVDQKRGEQAADYYRE
ncbi:hypothetical protein GEMRC1_002815 [Eukaryota sp. GEM-RC1]